MSICILGGGLAGLAAATHAKILAPQTRVVVISNGKSGNSVMAGQRFRPRLATEPSSEAEALVKLLAQRNGAELPAMEQFAGEAVRLLRFWSDFAPNERDRLTVAEDPAWFGPQWGEANAIGQGRGRSVISLFQAYAVHCGVEFIKGEVVRLNRESSRIGSVLVRSGMETIGVAATAFVLAAGSIGGRLFHSTNVSIPYSSQELAHEADLELDAPHLHMFHILGNCGADGRVKVGCFETDALAGAQVYLRDEADQFSIFDAETTRLLAEHQGHYHFKSIAARFLRHGGVVQLRQDNQKPRHGRVSHHYSHLGVRTTDGTRIAGLENAYAVGDAVGTTFWTGMTVRLPGMALTNCLVTAWLAARDVTERFGGSRQLNVRQGEAVPALPASPLETRIRDINTESATQIEFGNSPVKDLALAWTSQLDALGEADPQTRTLLEISMMMSRYHLPAVQQKRA